MEYIPGYDQWKTSLPEEQKPKEHCAMCGDPIYEGDVLYTVDGGLCENCMEDRYRTII